MGSTDRILPSGNTQIESSSSQAGYGLTLNGQVLVTCLQNEEEKVNTAKIKMQCAFEDLKVLRSR